MSATAAAFCGAALVLFSATLLACGRAEAGFERELSLVAAK
ncbi:hypothetical protein BRUCa_2514 [Brucella melitensis]